MSKTTNKAVKDKFKPGDTVYCTFAMTTAYTVGHAYDVVKHDKSDITCIRANDGHLDMLALVASKFSKEHPHPHLRIVQ